MENAEGRRRALRIEATLWIVMGALALLAREDPRLHQPQALPLFVLLLLSSLATSVLVRLVPARRCLQSLSMLCGLAAVAGLQRGSGGAESTLWVLYLLPLFGSTILLRGRETALVVAGACAANAGFHALSPDPWGAASLFELALKTGILAGAAASTWTLSRAEQDLAARADRQRDEIVRLEESLRAAAAVREAERGLAAIAGAGAGAVHDLGTPLMVVRAYARLHLEQADLDATLARDLARIDGAAAFCQTLVADILARDYGPAASQPVAEIVSAAVALAEPVLAERRVTARLELLDTGLCVRAGRQELERVLLNLLVNAGKAMPEGGGVAVRVGRDDSGSWPWIAIAVEDTGPGIAEQLLPRLFEPFATTRSAQGDTGLGLHLSREIAQRLGGTLHAENRPEGGARFMLRLPAEAGAAPVCGAA